MGLLQFISNVLTDLAKLLSITTGQAVKVLEATDGYISTIDNVGKTLDGHSSKMLQDVQQEMEADRIKFEAMMAQAED